MSKRIWSILLMISMILSAVPAFASGADWSVTDLQCNAMTAPLGVDEQQPILSWRMEASHRGAKQTAYQVVVKNGDTTVWDSGKVESDACSVKYAGAALVSTAAYDWTVTVWNESGESRSASAVFETAFMNGSEFDAPLISATEAGGYYGDFTVEYDVQVENHSGGFIYAGTDVNNNMTVQIKTKSGIMQLGLVKTENGKGGGAGTWTISGVNLTDTVHVKIEVVGTTATYSVNGTEIATYSHALNSYGIFGFRHFGSSSDQEYAYYDNLKVTDEEGKTLLSFDFSAVNPFAVGTLVDGRLYVMPISGNYSVRTVDEMTGASVPSYSGDYTVEYDVQVPAGTSASFIFAGSSSSNFVSFQINPKNGKYSIVKHENGKGARAADLNDSTLADKKIHVKIDVVGTTATIYADTVKIFDYTHVSLVTFGVFGFRHYNSGNDQEKAYYDNLAIKTAAGDNIYFCDFSEKNPFKVGSLEDGRLYVEPIAGNISVSTLEELTTEVSIADAFTIETEFKIVSGALGVVFGGTDSRNLLFWQINTAMGASNEKVYLRPHATMGGSTSNMGNVDITSALPWAERNDWHTLKIAVVNGEIKTYIDDTLVDTRSHALATMTQVGFRLTKGDGEVAWIDNYTLTDGSGKALISADFEDHLDPFSTGRTQNGALFLDKVGLFIRDVEQKGAPMFRSDFTVDGAKTVKKARLYATSLGTYAAYINGKEVSDDRLAPGWTEYFDRVDYQTYDVTALLQSGNNAIGAVVGNGWYAGHVGEGNSNFEYYGRDVAFKGQLIITYTDGTTQVIKTGTDWTYSTDSPYLVTDHQNGETYDATREQAGWNDVGFDDSDWTAAALAAESEFNTQLNLSAIKWNSQDHGGVKVYTTLTPKSVTKVADDAYVFDMGQNFAGVVTLKATGEKGQTVRLRYGEMLYDENDGELEGQLYAANLRTAHATDYYTFGANGTVEYTPYFTYHGFRYVEVAGLGYAPSVEDLVGVVWSNVTEKESELETSSDLINQIYSNTFWSQLSNYISIPTDCPQRDERLGWTGDAQVFAMTATLNADVNAFLQNFLTLLYGKQGDNGGLPNIAPNHGTGKASGFTPGWTDAAVVIPYVLYQAYGDISVLEESYPHMAKYIDCILSAAKYQTTGNLIITTGSYGDWLSVKETTPRGITSTNYFGYVTKLMGEMAEILGKTEDVQYYENLFKEISDQFKAAYVSADGLIVGDTQTCYALSLGTGILMDDVLEQKCADRLAAKIIENETTLTTGFLGVNFLCPMLSEYGYSNLAYDLVMQTAYPSWGYSVVNGATTIWERWNSYIAGGGLGANSALGSTMNSYNHYSYGAVVEWMYEDMAGINPDIKDPGYHHIIISPEINNKLSYVNATHDSAYGKITSNWAVEGNDYTLTVTVPANAYATVYAPGTATVDDMTCVMQDGNIFEIQSGTYVFTGTLDTTPDVTKLEGALNETDLSFWQKNFGNTAALAQAINAAEAYLDAGVYTDAETTAHIDAIAAAKKAATPISKKSDADYVNMKDFAENPTATDYQITTVSEWIYFGDLVRAGNTFAGKTVHLMKSLDFEGLPMSGVGMYTDDYAYTFKGTFDGHYHMLKNVNIYNAEVGVGAFNSTNGATLKAFGISGSVCGSGAVGGIVGYGDGGTDIIDCWNEADVYSLSTTTGTAGIAANLRQAGTITRCYNVGTIGGPTNVAGICSWGQNGNNAAVITDCYNMGILVYANDNGATDAIVRYNGTVTGKTFNSYYLTGIGTNAAVSGTTAKNAAAFTDGTVAAALNMLQGETHPILVEPEVDVDLGIDVNGDGETNVADVSSLLSYLNGNAEIDADLADVNEDGKISLADAARLLKLLNE